jgi:hypothetical protein
MFPSCTPRFKEERCGRVQAADFMQCDVIVAAMKCRASEMANQAMAELHRSEDGVWPRKEVSVQTAIASTRELQVSSARLLPSITFDY